MKMTRMMMTSTTIRPMLDYRGSDDPVGGSGTEQPDDEDEREEQRGDAEVKEHG
jgi:hypothetical protein